MRNDTVEKWNESMNRRTEFKNYLKSLLDKQVAKSEKVVSGFSPVRSEEKWSNY